MMAFINIIANFALLTGLVSGAPYLGVPFYHQTLVDPYVYLPPNHSPHFYQSHPYQQIFGTPLHQQQLISAPTSSASDPDQHLYQVTSQVGQTIEAEKFPEINQFHSEDAQGRVLYGFHGHNQARMEARDAQGRVRGSYSYIDPNGQLVRMDYWDDGTGFQARGNNIPKLLYDVPGFTPEVQAAREEHFKLYQQILLSTVQAQQSHAQTSQSYPSQTQPPHVQPPNKLPAVDDYPYVERPDGGSTSPTGFEDDDDTVEVGVYPNQPNDMPAYDRPTNFPSYPNRPSNLPLYPLQPSNQPMYPNRPNDFSSYPSSSDDHSSYPGSMRLPGSIQQPSFPFQGIEDEDPESIALDNPEFQDLGRGAKSLEVKDSSQEGTNQNDEVKNLEKMSNDEKKMHEKSDTKKNSDGEDDKRREMSDRMMTESDGSSKIEEMKLGSEGHHNGFSYHIQYRVGSPAKLQSIPHYNKVSSMAASEPVSLNSKTTLHRVHPLPVETMTGYNNDMNVMARPSAVHDSQMRPHQDGLQHPMVIKTYRPSVPAIHDQQIMRTTKTYTDFINEQRKN